RAHLAQPLGIAVELREDARGAEVLDYGARERRADARHARHQPKRDAFRRLRQRRVEGVDLEAPAVPCMLGERAAAHELLAGAHVPERADERDALAVALLAERR